MDYMLFDSIFNEFTKVFKQNPTAWFMHSSHESSMRTWLGEPAPNALFIYHAVVIFNVQTPPDAVSLGDGGGPMLTHRFGGVVAYTKAGQQAVPINAPLTTSFNGAPITSRDGRRGYAETRPEHSCTWKKYHGFTESYEYCDCGKKR